MVRNIEQKINRIDCFLTRGRNNFYGLLSMKLGEVSDTVNEWSPIVFGCNETIGERDWGSQNIKNFSMCVYLYPLPQHVNRV